MVNKKNTCWGLNTGQPFIQSSTFSSFKEPVWQGVTPSIREEEIGARGGGENAAGH